MTTQINTYEVTLRLIRHANNEESFKYSEVMVQASNETEARRIAREQDQSGLSVYESWATKLD